MTLCGCFHDLNSDGSCGIYPDPKRGTMQAHLLQVSTLMPVSETKPSSPAGHLPLLSKSTPDSIGNNIETLSRSFPTIADRTGADNLTVESPSIDQAVESLKRILPNIQGRLVDENNRGPVGEVVLGVMIPSDAYGNVTTELINHGAVASGMKMRRPNLPHPLRERATTSCYISALCIPVDPPALAASGGSEGRDFSSPRVKSHGNLMVSR